MTSKQINASGITGEGSVSGSIKIHVIRVIHFFIMPYDDNLFTYVRKKVKNKCKNESSVTFMVKSAFFIL